ncbi:hypothetical protein GCM10027405_27280 [Arthrobacter alkaliphilus]
MLPWSRLNVFLDAHRDDDPQFEVGTANTKFPSGQLTSSAWEGWWHDGTITTATPIQREGL